MANIFWWYAGDKRRIAGSDASGAVGSNTKSTQRATQREKISNSLYNSRFGSRRRCRACRPASRRRGMSTEPATSDSLSQQETVPPAALAWWVSGVKQRPTTASSPGRRVSVSFKGGPIVPSPKSRIVAYVCLSVCFVYPSFLLRETLFCSACVMLPSQDDPQSDAQSPTYEHNLADVAADTSDTEQQQQ